MVKQFNDARAVGCFRIQHIFFFKFNLFMNLKSYSNDSNELMINSRDDQRSLNVPKNICVWSNQENEWNVPVEWITELDFGATQMFGLSICRWFNRLMVPLRRFNHCIVSASVNFSTPAKYSCSKCGRTMMCHESNWWNKWLAGVTFAVCISP